MTIALLLALGCKTAEAPSPAPAARSKRASAQKSDWHRGGDLRQIDADARCAEEKPHCRRAFAVLHSPPSRCANQGTPCEDVISTEDFWWSCACDACLEDADCGAGRFCVRASSCEGERFAAECRDEKPPPPPPCPPPEPDRPLPR